MNLLFTLILLLISLSPPLPCAAESEDHQTNALNIGKLRLEISSHEEKIEQSGKEELSLLDQLEKLDEKIKTQKVKIHDLQTRIQGQQKVIAAKEQELSVIINKNAALQQHLIKRLQSFYLMGKTGFLNILFSNKNLPDLLLTNDAYHSLVTYDQAIFDTYRENLAAIERVKRAHELEQSMLEKFLADTDQENATLQQTAEEQNRLLKRVQTQRSLYEQAVKEMKKAAGHLTATLTSTTKPQDQKARGFALNKGKLPPPVWGKVIGKFNQAASDTDDPIFTNGITVQTPEGSEVYAVFDGVVIFSGYMRGYGKMVIIDHDQQYYSVTARFDEIQVNEGDPIKQGQVIGVTGEIATLYSKGLYFEIRHGEIAENPMDWLKPGTLTAR